MKIFTILVAAGLFSVTAHADSSLATASDVSPAKKTKQAESVMLKECKKEFPENVNGKTLDEVDQWAEAQENAAEPQEFKKSRCYSTHEKWEKLAQRNEWSPENVAARKNAATRLPASN